MDLQVQFNINPISPQWAAQTTIVIAAFVLLQCLDIVTGLMVAWSKGEISSKVSRVGVTRKTLSLLSIAAVALGKMILVQVQPDLVNLPIIMLSAVWASATELISIGENLNKFGQLNPFVRHVITTLKRFSEQPGPKE